jgi:hypothetical protein
MIGQVSVYDSLQVRIEQSAAESVRLAMHPRESAGLDRIEVVRSTELSDAGDLLVSARE